MHSPLALDSYAVHLQPGEYPRLSQLIMIDDFLRLAAASIETSIREITLTSESETVCDSTIAEGGRR